MAPQPKSLGTLADPESGAKLLSAAQAARYLDYHPVSIRRLVVRGDLKPHSKVGHAFLFQREELDRFKYSNAWASKKAGITFLPNPPPMPTTGRALRAVVTVTKGRKEKLYKRLNVFHWEDIPSLRSQVDSKFGKVRFTITVQLPDGCGFELKFLPSLLEASQYEKLGIKRRGKGEAWLIG